MLIGDTRSNTLHNLNMAMQKTITYELHTYKKLVTALEAYNQLMLDELNDVVPIAHVHGWRSNRVGQGKETRETITQLKSQLKLKDSFYNE